MTTINTPNSWYDKLKSKIKWRKQSEIFEALDIPLELKFYRKTWKEKIHWIDDKTKEKIIKVAKRIPIKIETDSDWSRLIKFKLWNKMYKILDPELKNHLDHGGFSYVDYFDTVRVEPLFHGCVFQDDGEKWENKKLGKYVKEKQWQWLHIPKWKEMREILQKIGETANLDNIWDQIAMLMYLTGMDGSYWLGWDRDDRCELQCFMPWWRDVVCRGGPRSCDSLCMIAVE